MHKILFKKRTLFKSMLAIPVAMVLSTVPSFATDWASLITKLDNNRIFSGDGMIMNLKLESYKDGALDSSETMKIYTNVDDRQTVVIFNDPSRKGQKMLMKDNNFWILMPKSSRPVRISAVQRVMGEASSGDIASLSYTQDYDVVDGVDNGDTVTVTLKAKTKSVTYDKAILVVEKARAVVLSAEFFLKSGKKSKEASFTYRQDGDLWRTNTIDLVDAMRNNRKTVMYYSDERAVKLSSRLFNPRYLMSGGKLPS